MDTFVLLTKRRIIAAFSSYEEALNAAKFVRLGGVSTKIQDVSEFGLSMKFDWYAADHPEEFRAAKAALELAAPDGIDPGRIDCIAEKIARFGEKAFGDLDSAEFEDDSVVCLRFANGEVRISIS